MLPNADPAEAMSTYNKKSGAVLIHVSCDHRVHRQAQGGAIERGDDEHAPRTQRLEQRPQECGVAQKDVLDGVQCV